MARVMLGPRIRGATVAATELNYEGSTTSNTGLLQRTELPSSEWVHVLNTNKGQRFATYAVADGRGSGEIVLDGPVTTCG